MLRIGSWIAVVVLLVACVAPAHADITFLLQEPYGHLGGLSPTGHAAIYFSRICADSPTVLRRCHPGEVGAVVSRYNKINGYDWMAVSLIPYLYAVDRVEDVPTSVSLESAGVLRDQYRRQYLHDLVPDIKGDGMPGGNWIQLVGAAYNRKMYAFQIPTTEAQDDQLIQRLNSRPNKTKFNFFFNNCADFASHIVNFYYPHAVHRSYIADLGLMTPKQLAKSLVKYHKKHSDVGFSVYVIPQVSGTVSRSTAVHGVTESLLKTKKYLLPLAYFQPIVTGGMATAYLTKGRFNPGHNATVLESPADLSLMTGIQDRPPAHQPVAAEAPTSSTSAQLPVKIGTMD